MPSCTSQELQASGCRFPNRLAASAVQGFSTFSAFVHVAVAASIRVYYPTRTFSSGCGAGLVFPCLRSRRGRCVHQGLCPRLNRVAAAAAQGLIRHVSAFEVHQSIFLGRCRPSFCDQEKPWPAGRLLIVHCPPATARNLRCASDSSYVPTCTCYCVRVTSAATVVVSSFSLDGWYEVGVVGAQ